MFKKEKTVMIIDILDNYKQRYIKTGYYSICVKSNIFSDSTTNQIKL